MTILEHASKQLADHSTRPTVARGTNPTRCICRECRYARHVLYCAAHHDDNPAGDD